MPSIHIQGRDLHYVEQGTGFPIVFMHSFLWDKYMWKPQLDALSKHYRCISVDLWNHGESDVIGRPDTTLSEIADDYAAFIHAMGLTHYGLVGLSIGGMIAARLAIDYPQAVSALVIMDSSVAPEPLITQKRYLEIIGACHDAGKFPEEIIEAVAPLFFCTPTLENNKPLVESFKESLRSYPKDKISELLSIATAIFTRPSWIEALSLVEAPTLIMTGQYDTPRPPHESEMMAQHVPNAECVIIPNAGHISNLEQPEFVTDKLERFLSSIPAAVLATEEMAKAALN